MKTLRASAIIAIGLFLAEMAGASAGESWVQFKGDGRHSGNAPEKNVTTPLGLIGAAALTDAVFTAPVVADGRVYVVDGSGVVHCLDAATLGVLWTYKTRGGPANCNNLSSPAIAGKYLHVGTMAGTYYVLDAASGAVVKEIACGEPIFSTPVVGDNRVYFATLGSRVYALQPDGAQCWTWDYVQERLGFKGNRWSGEDWLKHKNGKRVTWRDQFCCSRDIALDGKTLVIPAGGETIFLRDAGDRAELQVVGLVPSYSGSELPATFGISIGEDGAVYRQWHRRDNTSRVEVFRIRDGKVETDYVRGTETEINRSALMSFCSVSLRGQDVYRCRPEEGFGFCKHSPDRNTTQYPGSFPSIASPILLRDKAVYGGLDGSLYVVPLSGSGEVWSFKTAFGKAITAPAAVCDGRVYFGCEDGYLYALGPGGKAPLPTKDLQLGKIRSPLASPLRDPQYDWFTNFGNLQNNNTNKQGVAPPFQINWIRRYEGTFKHVPVCGGGRMYIHTAEGQIFAVEQETGRLLWRRYWPGVHLSFTAPIYREERLLVPQAGMKGSRLRCLDAATGDLLWEAPFTGSPSWSRQEPPVIYKNLAIYMFGSGTFAAQGSEKAFVYKGTPVPSPDGSEVMSWIYTHENPYYPRADRPTIRAWNLETGKEVWTRDFSEFGCGGNDSGLCLMDNVLYYSTFFGYSPRKSQTGQPSPTGLTAALDPETGRVLWTTTKYSVTAGCTISGRDGRLYLGGFNRPDPGTQNRYVWCLDARDGSLIWQSEPAGKAVNVVTVGEKVMFAHGSSGLPLHLFDKETGKIAATLDMGYACTRFTFSEPYIVGCNMDLIDTSNGNKLVTTGPCVDARDCIGAIVSNGRIFYTSQACGLQASQLCGKEAASSPGPWK